MIAFAALTLLVPAGRAQTPVADTEAEAHPAHIHSGTCDQLGDVVYPLADVTYPTGEQMGTAGGHEVKISEVNHIDVPLQDLLDGEYAINVHLSAEEIGTYIACGNIGGVVHERENGERDGDWSSASASSMTRAMSGSPGSATMAKVART